MKNRLIKNGYLEKEIDKNINYVINKKVNIINHTITEEENKPFIFKVQYGRNY